MVRLVIDGKIIEITEEGEFSEDTTFELIKKEESNDVSSIFESNQVEISCFSKNISFSINSQDLLRCIKFLEN